MTKLGVISDTHGSVLDTLRAVEIFRQQGVSVVIHCGDIGGTDIVRAFRGLETHFVYGNTDGESDLLREEAEATGGTLHGWSGSLEIEGKRIFFTHGHRGKTFREALDSGCWDLICYGHTHHSDLRMHGETLLLNPGAFQRVRTPQVAVVTLPEMTVQTFDVVLCCD